jgi:membrane fusion protein (multidrug efflux system)
MRTAHPNRRRTWIGSSVLLLTVLGAGIALAAWKRGSLREADAAAASHPEPMETVTAGVAERRDYRRTTTSIGTVIALRSITLHNELPGTVREVALAPGQIVEPGDVLIGLDVSVEEAELRAQEAQAALAESMLERMERASRKAAASETDVDRARAERDVALAQIERIKAIIARKVVRAPFRARVGMVDVHVGQYLHEGTQLTTLQGIDDAVHVDFTVTQTVAAGLRAGDTVDVFPSGGATAASATIVALDARVDPTTRNAAVRARLEGARNGPAPGASVRVRVPVGPPRDVVTVPVSALRRGPAGDHVFLLVAGEDGRTRAQLRQVRSGPMLDDRVVITEGLVPGDKVAASGSFKLNDSVLVAVADGAAAAAADARGH